MLDWKERNWQSGDDGSSPGRGTDLPRDPRQQLHPCELSQFI